MKAFTKSYWPSTLLDPLEFFPRGGTCESMVLQVFLFLGKLISRKAVLEYMGLFWLHCVPFISCLLALEGRDEITSKAWPLWQAKVTYLASLPPFVFPGSLFSPMLSPLQRHSLFPADHSLMGNQEFRSPQHTNTPPKEWAATFTKDCSVTAGTAPWRPWQSWDALGSTWFSLLVMHVGKLRPREEKGLAQVTQNRHVTGWGMSHRTGRCTVFLAVQFILIGPTATFTWQAVRLPWMHLSCGSNPMHILIHHTVHGQKLLCTRIYLIGVDRMTSLTVTIESCLWYWL